MRVIAFHHKRPSLSRVSKKKPKKKSKLYKLRTITSWHENANYTAAAAVCTHEIMFS